MTYQVRERGFPHMPRTYELVVGGKVIRSQLSPYGEQEAERIVLEHGRPSRPIKEIAYTPGRPGKGSVRTYGDEE